MNQGMNMNIDIAALPNVTCSCGSDMWLSGSIIKKLSKIQSPTGQEQLIPIPVIFCIKCGKTIDETEEIGGEEKEEKSSIIMKG